MPDKDGCITPGDRVGSSDILDMLYDSDDGERKFLEVARRNLGFKFIFDPEACDYVVTNPKLLPGEAKAINAVIAAGDRYGYGNMIAHLKKAWVELLVSKRGISVETAIKATNLYAIASSGMAGRCITVQIVRDAIHNIKLDLEEMVEGPARRELVELMNSLEMILFERKIPIEEEK